jgi:hypothetical protein
LFINIRSAASCGHPLHVSDVPRGDRMMRVAVVIVDEVDEVDERLVDDCLIDE